MWNVTLDPCRDVWSFPVGIWHLQFDAWRQTMTWMKIKMFKLKFVEIQNFCLCHLLECWRTEFKLYEENLHCIMCEVAVATCCTRGPDGHTSWHHYILKRSERKKGRYPGPSQNPKTKKCVWSSYCLCRNAD